MNSDYIIQLTLALYRATMGWNETNFLKVQARRLSNEILTDFILASYQTFDFDIRSRLFSNIQAIQVCLHQARSQKLISRREFLLFQEEYNKITREFKKPKPVDYALKPISLPEQAQSQNVIKITAAFNKRQKKILEILKNKQKAQVWELKEFFSDISKRTLRRDLDELLKKGLVKRQGEWNEVFYVLVDAARH